MVKTLTLIAGIVLMATGGLAFFIYVVIDGQTWLWGNYGVCESSGCASWRTIITTMFANVLLSIGMITAGLLLTVQGARSQD